MIRTHWPCPQSASALAKEPSRRRCGQTDAAEQGELNVKALEKVILLGTTY